MANRLRVRALAVLAVLNLFTIGAGVSVAAMLPGRLALWRVPQVVTAPAAGGAPVLAPDAPTGSVAATSRLITTLLQLLDAPELGKHTGAIVTDLTTGAVLFSQEASGEFAPASSEKVLTAAAALTVLGPDTRFTTRVAAGAANGQIVLVGGGDPTLAAGRPPASDYPQPATLASLAAATARRLRARGERTVSLSYDTSLFTGPAMAPGWKRSYVTTGNVTPITALEVDQGRLAPSGAPQDADDPTNFRPRSFTPAAQAADSFAAFLRADGIRVPGRVTTGAAPTRSATIAAVQSPMVSALVAWMLRESNNVIAEDLARQVALRTRQPATFAGAAAAITSALRPLGITSGVHLVDGSGLSPLDRVSPDALVTVMRAAGRASPALRPLLAGLPVTGFSGTLDPGQSVFGQFGAAARGMVRAKTGNLTRVASLTGVAQDTDGQLLGFAFMADAIPAGKLAAAAGRIDQAATALAGCGCR